jgi:hypothetical protein
LFSYDGKAYNYKNILKLYCLQLLKIKKHLTVQPCALLRNTQGHLLSCTNYSQRSRARICRPLEVPRNRFPSWRASTTTLFFVPARRAT